MNSEPGAGKRPRTNDEEQRTNPVDSNRESPRRETPGRIFVSEFVCGGAWPEDSLEPSLAREGRAMLTAIVADLLRIPGCEVVTTWDRRLGEFPSCEVAGTLVNPGEPRLKIHCATPQDEAEQFRNLCRTSDAALVIAPEFDGILTDRVATAAPLTTILGPDEPAVSLCSDKLILARFLEERQIATVPTALVNLTEPASHWKFPVVLKPQNGAGSLQTFLVTNSTEFVRRCHEASGAGWASRFIHQPFIPGEPISAAVIIDSTGQRHFLPGVRQLLSENRRFEYLGAGWNPLMGNWQRPAPDA
ncbi:MAG: ATP-grasp domain-containing protein, partial [Planctomycetes bacterium]|nr:ATP-grasp domain-containing protein [Planctomycetota bacterium]